jgi:acetyl esterase/lipase
MNMRMKWMIAALFGCSVASAAENSMLTWSDVEKRPLPAAGTRLSYGKEALQSGELRLPQGKGPHPLVVLFHGGCWLSDFDYKHATPLAEALAKAGYATWTPEYRRVGDAGGGWPGTFDDVRAASDFVRDIARERPIDLARVAFVGHSAGGQIALYLASREGDPVRPRLVVGLAAITDLETYRIGPADSCHASVDRLMGGTPQEQPLRYAQVSPLNLLPLPVRAVLIQGGRDKIVSLESAKAYAKAAGDRAKLVTIRSAGHFEVIVPEGESWEALLGALKELL